jgi:transcription elongation factor GreA
VFEAVTIGDLVSNYIQSLKLGKKEAQNDLAKFVRWIGGNRLLFDVSPSELEDYSSKEGMSDPDSLRLKTLRNFLNYAKEIGVIDGNMAIHVKIRRTNKKVRNSSAILEITRPQLTQEGYSAIELRLEHVQGELLLAADEVKKAAADKDVKENAPLEAAREHLGKLDAERRDLQDTILTAQILSSDITGGSAHQGGKVKLKDLSNGRTASWMLVDAREASLADQKLSISSPVGKAVLGYYAGQEFIVETPGGIVNYKLLEVE